MSADRAPDATPAALRQSAPKRKPGAPPGNQNRTVTGRFRATKGAKRRTPVNADEYDAQGRRRAREVYANLGPEWDAERRSYGEEFGLELRTMGRGRNRGLFDKVGNPKPIVPFLMDLKKRRADRERAVREHRLRLAGGAVDGEEILRVVRLHDGTPLVPEEEPASEEAIAPAQLEENLGEVTVTKPIGAVHGVDPQPSELKDPGLTEPALASPSVVAVGPSADAPVSIPERW
jgi:hypothetical protein